MATVGIVLLTLVSVVATISILGFLVAAIGDAWSR